MRRPLTTPRASSPSSPTESNNEDSVGQVRLRLDLAYDGSEFHGWAVQPGVRTVQGALQSALDLLLKSPQPAELTVAGRTDAGVHARGQVAHLDVSAETWGSIAGAALRRLNRVLPGDIRVYEIKLAPPGFDARFSALGRRYSYRVCDDPAYADPLRRRDTLWHRASLDEARMNAAATSLLGEHDFAAFCRRREGASTIRELQRLDWQRQEPGVLVGTFVADAFCHNMVRALTGALLSVGDGTGEVNWIAAVLAARVRNPSVRVAPPHALCLEQVEYPPDSGVAARAHRTRRLRSASSNTNDSP